MGVSTGLGVGTIGGRLGVGLIRGERIGAGTGVTGDGVGVGFGFGIATGTLQPVT